MLNDPCMTAGLAETFNSSVNESLITGILNGTGDFDLCLKYLQTLFKQLFLCSGAAPCLTQQLPFSLDNNDFYGFSEFWYSMEDVLRIGGNYQYYKFRKASKVSN